MRILFSTSYAMTLQLKSGRYCGHDITVSARSSDWGLKGILRYLHYAKESFVLLRKAQNYDAVVLFSVGMEAFLVGLMGKLFRYKPRIICADFLIPRPSRALQFVADGLKNIDAFICIRKGDIETLYRRFQIPASRCSFAPFPFCPGVLNFQVNEGDYVYSAGWAHRDWATLLRALEQVNVKAVLSVGGELNVPEPLRSRVKVLPQRSPNAGRLLMADAALVVLPLAETELPSGPLVMLDAMAMGKAVIVTDVNGSRDYVIPECTARMVAPGDSEALVKNIRELMGNRTLRQSVGKTAREDVQQRFTTERFVNEVIRTCTTE